MTEQKSLESRRRASGATAVAKIVLVLFFVLFSACAVESRPVGEWHSTVSRDGKIIVISIAENGEAELYSRDLYTDRKSVPFTGTWKAGRDNSIVIEKISNTPCHIEVDSSVKPEFIILDKCETPDGGMNINSIYVSKAAFADKSMHIACEIPTFDRNIINAIITTNKKMICWGVTKYNCNFIIPISTRGVQNFEFHVRIVQDYISEIRLSLSQDRQSYTVERSDCRPSDDGSVCVHAFARQSIGKCQFIK